MYARSEQGDFSNQINFERSTGHGDKSFNFFFVFLKLDANSARFLKKHFFSWILQAEVNSIILEVPKLVL